MKIASQRQQGFTLLEMMFATVILTVAAVGVCALFGSSMLISSTQGDHGTRTTEYAQDKMEQLMTLTFSDTASDPTQYPTASSGGVGLTAGGSINPATPASHYVDYIAGDGTPSPSSTNAAYKREWLIADDNNSPHQIKTITVGVQKIAEANGVILPSTTLVSQKGSM
ncbi:MAG: prepilin-type N-terminal cleavage/methylation domain-containing protein [Terriglobales bacterium]